MRPLALLMLLTLSVAAAQQDVTLRFDARAGTESAVCGITLPGLGTNSTPVRLQDFRFFVSDVRFLTEAGEEVPVTLAQDGRWQVENVALLDFEDATGACAEVGTAEMNAQIVGTVPEGDYTGVVFTLGVPFALNHVDASSAPSPLNLTAMYWSWQGGYKFARIELLSAAEAQVMTVAQTDADGLMRVVMRVVTAITRAVMRVVTVRQPQPRQVFGRSIWARPAAPHPRRSYRRKTSAPIPTAPWCGWTGSTPSRT